MLERVVLHQARFRVPGIEADARGIALGNRALVLFSSIDRLVTFLAAYSAGHSLDAVARSMTLDVVKSELGLREVVLSFDAGSSDRLDGVSDVARVSGGLVFTGTSRHFVEYRNGRAPFGWDASELLADNRALLLYHSTFSQSYDVERPIDVRALVLRLAPHIDRTGTAKGSRGPMLLLVSPGLGPVLARHFARASLDAGVAIVDLPPRPGQSDMEAAWLFDVPDLPPRFSLLRNAPGVRCFLPVSAGVGVEEGFRHPLNLRAFPFFTALRLVLFRGGETALEIERRPEFLPVRSLVRSSLGSTALRAAPHPGAPASFDLSLRLAPSGEGQGEPRALFVPNGDLPILRRLAYVLSPATLRTARVSFANGGAFLVGEGSLVSIPLGTFYRAAAPRIFSPLGLSVVPRISEAALVAAIGAPENAVTFFLPDGRIAVVDGAAFVSLDRALVEGAAWAPLPAESLDVELPADPSVHLEPLGFRPLSHAREMT